METDSRDFRMDEPGAEGRLVRLALALGGGGAEGGLFVDHEGRVAQLDPLDSITVGAAVAAVKRSRGCSTPLEEFLASLLRSYGAGALDSKMVQFYTNSYREDVELLQDILKDVARTNPRLLRDALEASENAKREGLNTASKLALGPKNGAGD